MKFNEPRALTLTGRLQQSLPPTDIMPSIELSSDFAVNADQLEAHSFMQADACFVWQRDAGKGSVITHACCGGQQPGV